MHHVPPLMAALSVLVRLAPPCHQPLAEAGMPVDLPDRPQLYTCLGEQSELLFMDCAFAATQCARAQRQDLVDRLCQALDQCGR
jgi:hypothetical protein